MKNFRDYTSKVVKGAFLAIFLVLVKSISGQDYRQYHIGIVKADQQLAEMKFREAAAIYDSIFSLYPRRYYVDLHNAFLCNLKFGNTSRAIELAKELALYGYILDDFKRLDLDEFERSPQWQAFLAEYPKLHDQFSCIVKPAKRAFINNLLIFDQTHIIGKPLRVQDSIFIINTIRIDSLFKADGIPDIFMRKDSLGFRLQTCLRHFFGLYNNGRQYNLPRRLSKPVDPLYRYLDSTLRAGIIGGIITPTNYLGISTYFESTNRYGSLSCKVDFDKEEVTLNKPNYASFGKVNMNRKEIGLPEINEECIKRNMSTLLPLYPFKEVKAKLDAFNPKDQLDLMRFLMNIWGNLISDPNPLVAQHFIVKDQTIFVDGTYYEGIEKYYKWLKKDGIGSK